MKMIHDDGETRIDRQYVWGNVKVLEAKYVGVAFSDHQVLIVKIKLPSSVGSVYMPNPKCRSRFKAKPEVFRDPIFHDWLKAKFCDWLKNKG